MCQVQIVKYTGCGCEIYETTSRCSVGDGNGNCSGQARYERAVKDGYCQRAHCTAYSANPKPRSRWAAHTLPTGYYGLGSRYLECDVLTLAKPVVRILDESVGFSVGGRLRLDSRNHNSNRSNSTHQPQRAQGRQV